MNYSLLSALVVREFKGKYRRSALGPLWAIIQPLAYMVIFIFLRDVLNISTSGPPYAIFAFAALVPWTFFANSVTRAIPSVSSNAAIVKKIKVQAEIFPLATVTTTLIDFAISFVTLLAMMVWFSIPMTWALLWVPVLILITALFALGIGLGGSALGTFRRDIVFVIPFALQFMMLATPIIYPLTKVPQQFQALVSLNPMVGVVEGFRSVVLHGATPDLGLLAVSLTVTALVWLISWPFFRFTSGYYADAL